MSLSDPLGHARVPDLAGVEGQLAELWRQASTDEQAVVRACALNLVVACANGDEDVQEATRAVATVSETSPGRALVIAPLEDSASAAGPGELNVFVSAHCHRGAGGAQVCSEQVTLEARGEGLDLVPGTILQLLVEDMPVVTWWRRPELQRDPLLSPLLDQSDLLIVNSSRMDGPLDKLRQLYALVLGPSWPGHATDVTWARLEPWREALASFFDAPAMRGHLERVTRVTLTASGPASSDGVTAAGAYLAGWLASRLGWSPGRRPLRWRRRDGDPVTFEFRQDAALPPGEIASARIDAAGGELPLAFEARRVGRSSEFVSLGVDSGGASLARQRIRLPSRDEAALLCGILQRSERDAIFEAALGAAAQLMPAG